MLGALKSPSAKAKGLEMSGSPYWSGSELFVGVKLLKNCEMSVI